MKRNDKWRLVLITGVWLIISISCVVMPDKEVSESERRKLAQFPSITVHSLTSGEFMEKFEAYTLDQFPIRDSFRTLKAVTSIYTLAQKDNNNFYEVDGYIAKLEYPLNESSVDYALERMQYIYESYLKGKCEDIYLAVVPDKGYYLAAKNGYMSMNYETLFEKMMKGASYAQFIQITDELEVESYYQTDTHWRQEKLKKVASAFGNAMGIEEKLRTDYEMKEAMDSFYGVYYGQSALPHKGEKLYYLTNDVLDACVVWNFEDDAVKGIYDAEKLESRDPYEFFLSGSTPLITIENPNAEEDKELIVFRDSFGSSLVPLLVEGYSKITLLDTRYMKSELIGDYVEFEGQDVLFLYSTLLLNSSYSMK